MSTSGTGFRSRDGKILLSKNIIDPFTGYPVDQLKSVTVVSDSPVSAEVLSTALLIDRDCIDRRSLSGSCNRVIEVVYDSVGSETLTEIFS